MAVGLQFGRFWREIDDFGNTLGVVPHDHGVQSQYFFAPWLCTHQGESNDVFKPYICHYHRSQSRLVSSLSNPNGQSSRWWVSLHNVPGVQIKI